MQKNRARAERVTRNKNKSWYSIRNAHSTRAEVFIFDEIGFFGITAQDFIDEIKDIDAKDIDLRINSPGGAVFEGMAIYNAIKRHSANVTVHVEALAASISAVIAMAGDRVVMAKNSQLMIHKAFTLSIGNAEELRKDAEVLDGIDITIADIFAEKTGESRKQILSLMDDTTWFLADEALEIGLIDSVGEESKEKNHFDLSLFNNCPRELVNYKEEGENENKFSAKNIERVLREAGLSRREARNVIARGYDGTDLCEADQRSANIVEDLIQSMTSKK